MSALYRIEGKGDESYVVDSMGAGVVVSVTIECGYLQTITGAEIMRIICDGLNDKSACRDLISALTKAVAAECTLSDYQPEWEAEARAAIAKVNVDGSL